MQGMQGMNDTYLSITHPYSMILLCYQSIMVGYYFK